MSLTAEQVSGAYKLLLGRDLPLREALREAKLLASREELLASLIVRKRVFATEPEIEASLNRIAATHYVGTLRVRSERGDAVRSRAARVRLTESMKALVAACGSKDAVAKDAHAAMSSAARFIGGTDPVAAMQWSIESEK